MGSAVLLRPTARASRRPTGSTAPKASASDGHGGVLVADTQRDRLLAFDARLAPVGEIGAGRFTRPMGMDLDPAGGCWSPTPTPTACCASRRRRTRSRRHRRLGGARTDPDARAGGQFPPFTPGVARTYTTTVGADVLSTAGDAALTVTDPSSTAPGHLVNGTYALAAPLLVAGSPLPAVAKKWAAPVSHDPVTIESRSRSARTRRCARGRTAKTLTFTLSTTQP